MPLVPGKDIPSESELNAMDCGTVRYGMRRYFPEHFENFLKTAVGHGVPSERRALRELTILKIRKSGEDFETKYSPQMSKRLKDITEQPPVFFKEEKPPEPQDTKIISPQLSVPEKRSEAGRKVSVKSPSPSPAEKFRTAAGEEDTESADNLKTRIKRMVKRRLSYSPLAQYSEDHFAYILNGRK